MLTLYENVCKKCYIKGTRLRLSTNLLRLQLSLRFTAHLRRRNYESDNFCPLYFFLIGRHILNISKTIFPKLIFHLQLSYQVSDALLQEFYIHSTYVINHCI